MKLFTAVALVTVLNTSVAYQFAPDGTRSAAYRKAIERSTKKTVSIVPTTVDEQGPRDYWFHPRMHTFGNTGFLGGLHAAVAPLATKLIDILAYDGNDIRFKICRDLRRDVDREGARVLDLCCGVGISTRCLQEAFHDAEIVYGMDTSPEMIAMADIYSNPKTLPSKVVALIQHFMLRMQGFSSSVTKDCQARTIKTSPSKYVIGNAECTGFPDDDFDVVTIMYGFHEIPYVARDRILQEARRVLKDGGTLAVIDISPGYTPGPTMLAGEPYVLEYQAHILEQLRDTEGYTFEDFIEVVPNHVGLWLLKGDKTSTVEQTMKHAGSSFPAFLQRLD